MGRAAFPVVLLLAVLLSGCGDKGVDEETLIPRATSAQLQAAVERARELHAEGRCADARAAAREGQERVASLKRIDDALQANVEAWFDHLADQIRSTCGRDDEADEDETTPTETTPTETTPEPEPTETATPQPTATPTPEPTPTATPTPDQGNGNNGNGNGNNGNGNGNGGASGDGNGGATPEDGE